MKNIALILLVSLGGCSISESRQVNFSQEFKNKLTGIWVSNEYADKLFRTNSVTMTETLVSTYTDIVFDGDSTLHCNKPDLMEEDYLFINSDSSIISYQRNIIFRLTHLNDSLMTLVDGNNVIHEYSKVSSTLDERNIRFDVVRGSEYIRRKWIAGRYTFIKDTNKIELVIDDMGRVNGSKLFENCEVYSYEGSDLIAFMTPDNSRITYRIDKTDGKTFDLDEVYEILEEEQPLISKGEKGKLVRRK